MTDTKTAQQVISPSIATLKDTAPNVGDKVIFRNKEYVVNKLKYRILDKDLYDGSANVGPSVSPLEKDPESGMWFEASAGIRAYHQYPDPTVVISNKEYTVSRLKYRILDNNLYDGSANTGRSFHPLEKDLESGMWFETSTGSRAYHQYPDPTVVISDKEYTVSRLNYCKIDNNLYDGTSPMGPPISELQKDAKSGMWYEIGKTTGSRAYHVY